MPNMQGPMKTLSASILIIIPLFFYACQGNSQIIYKDKAGHTISESDLAHCTGQVNYEIMSKHPIQAAAKQLHDEARVFGQSGKYDEAIEKLETAIKMEPTWAYPVYDLAFTYLLKGDSAKALEYYLKTDQLEPQGFFTTKTAIYSLEGEKTGKFPPGLYIAYMQIEWTDDPEKKMQIAKIITEQVPAYAPAWKELANLTDDNTLRLEAINTGLSKNPDSETKGILLINKAIVLNDSGEKEEAKKILGDIIFSSETTRSNVELAKFTLKSIATK
jgi:tetratricopeptide (TPR) repeat protein